MGLTTRREKSRAKGVDALLKNARQAVEPEVLPAVSGGNPLPGRVQNGLAEAIGAPADPAFAAGFGTATQAVSDAATTFDSLRWYLISNYRQVLAQAYAEIGLVQTVTDVPVDDALRGGITIKSDQLSEDQIKDLTTSLDRDGELETAGQGAKWNRLHGGAGILILTDQDPATPLDVEAIGPDTPFELRAVDLWELFYDRQNEVLSDEQNAQLAEEEGPLQPDEESRCYSYYGHDVHESRVLKMVGMVAPSYLRPRLRGWGVSVVETLVRSINQYLKATNLGFEVLDEFKLDVFKIKNLTATLLSPNGTQAVAKRVQLAAWQKNYQNAMVMDSEDDFDHKQLSFAGLGEAMTGIKQQVAADLRFPMTKLFGISSAGFNSGEDDIENYNAMVESQVRQKLKKPLLRILELKCQKLFGMIPDDLEFEFKPLRVLSAVDEENVKTQKFNRLLAMKTAGLITDKEFREAVNKGGLADVKLDTSDSAIDAAEAEKQASLPAPGEGGGEEGGEGGETKPTPKPSPTDKTGGKAKKANAVRRYTTLERVERVLKNSKEYDLAAYAADGGDDWIDPRRAEIFDDDTPPVGADPALWQRARSASRETLGEIRWQFVTWYYRKLGGKFS